MKKLITLFAMAFATTSYAFFVSIFDWSNDNVPLEVVTTSTLKGPQGKLINNISKLAGENGITVTAKQTGGCGESVKYFESAKDPIGIIWSNSMYRNSKKSGKNCIIDYTKATPVLVTYAPYDICVRKGFKLEKGANYLLGNNRFNPQVSQLEHMNNNNMNITFKNVTYKGSGPVATALINNEIEVGLLATANAAPGVKAGSLECLYSTGSTKYGQKPLSELTGENPLSHFRLGMMMFVRNMDTNDIEKIQKAVSGLAKALAPQEMVDTSVVVTPAMLEEYVEGAKLQIEWK